MNKQILDVIKQQAMQAVENAGVPSEKREAAVDTTVSSLIEGFKKNLNLGNIPKLLSLFGGDSTQSKIETNPIIKSIQSIVEKTLVSQMGLSGSVATKISSYVTPAVLKMFTKGSEHPDNKFDLTDLVKSFGKEDGSSPLTNIIGSFLK